MKIHGSRYEHEPISGRKTSGMLLRFSFGIWNVGYADLQPWPEYGDAPLEKQIEELLSAKLTPLLQKCLWFAGHDSKARRQNRNLLHGLDLPTTHRLLDVSQKAEGFGFWKIKMSSKMELPKVPSGVRLRLDFNGRPKYDEFAKWWQALSPELKSSIDAIEDPYSTKELWCNSQFYSDWIDNPSWPGKVFKPMRDFSRHLYRTHRYKRVMFTHSLSHPFGQVAALWEAARFYKRYPHLRQAGGFSKVESIAFAPFNDVWQWAPPQSKPAPGLGFGFDSQLNDLKWERLL